MEIYGTRVSKKGLEMTSRLELFFRWEDMDLPTDFKLIYELKIKHFSASTTIKEVVMFLLTYLNLSFFYFHGPMSFHG